MNDYTLRRTISAGCLLLACIARGAEPDAVTLEAQIDEITAELSEYTARTPNSKEAYALRKAARDAWQAYTDARNDNAKVKQVQARIEKALAELRALQAQQDAAADAAPDLAALKQACADAIAAVRAASKDARAEAVLAARKARDIYVAARRKNSDVASLQSQIDTVKAGLEALNAEKQSVADGEAELVALKTAWQTAMAAAKAYLPDRAKLIELAQRRKALLTQLALLGGAQ